MAVKASKIIEIVANATVQAIGTLKRSIDEKLESMSTAWSARIAGVEEQMNTVSSTVAGLVSGIKEGFDSTRKEAAVLQERISKLEELEARLLSDSRSFLAKELGLELGKVQALREAVQLLADTCARQSEEIAVRNKEDREVLRQMVDTAIAKSSEPLSVEEINTIARAAAALVPPGKDGKDGIDGKDGKDGLDGKDGKNGLDGKDAVITDDILDSIVSMAVDRIPVPKDGKDGRDGIDGKSVQVTPELIDEIAMRVLPDIPVPKDGKDGKDGRDGIDGKDGKDGDSITEAQVQRMLERLFTVDQVAAAFEPSLAKWELDFERRASDTLQRVIDRLPVPKDGRDGRDGKDAFELEDFDADLLEDGRTVRMMFKRGDRVLTRDLKLPIPIWQGYYQKDGLYTKGTLLTHDGSLFMAMRDTQSSPATDDSWKLVVKRGRDGKQGAKGPKGDEGPRGPRGEEGGRPIDPMLLGTRG